MRTKLRWSRRFPHSANNFDLVLTNPHDMDPEIFNELLTKIEGVRHRGLTLSDRARKEFRRFFDNPTTPLKSAAYGLLSNWFMTQSGDRNSAVATSCEYLWDTLFPCRPPERLTSPVDNQNHIVVQNVFEAFWNCMLKAQGEECLRPEPATSRSTIEPAAETEEPSGSGDGLAQDRLRAVFDRQGLHCQVEGSPQALANFLRIVAGWGVR